MYWSVNKHSFGGILIIAWRCTSFIASTEFRNNNLRCIAKNKSRHDVRNISMSKNCANLQSSPKPVFDIQQQWFKRFEEDGIPEPDLSIKHIIKHVLNIEEDYLYEINQNKEVTEDQERQISTLCECRLARMPVQYIIKEWDFRDLRLKMSPPVFIPRPETEQLVDLVLQAATPSDVVLEVGCGSGAVSLSLCKALPHAQVIAIDQSRLACQLTTSNAQLNGLTSNLKVVHSKLQDDGSLSQPLSPGVLLGKVDLLVSNPPYVPSAQMLNLQPEIKLYEDLRALEAGRDGLRVIKALLLLAQSVLKPEGQIFLEVDSSHPKILEKYLADHPELNIKFIKTYKDFCERERFVKLVKL